MQTIWQTDFVVAQTQILARSLKHWTGRELLPGVSEPAELAQKVFEAPFVVVSHGTEADPVLNYGNAAALALWEMSWDEFTQTPSRQTAEISNRDARGKLLKAVAENGFAENYSGVRISKNRKRFKISNAVIWNLISESGKFCGQAAMFDRWEFL